MRKKVLSLMLCLAMVLTLIPASALAAEEAATINLGNYNKEVGECPTRIRDSIDSENYYVVYEDWYNVIDDISVTGTDVFEEGKLYTYTVFLEPYGNYAFPEDSEIVIDSIEWDTSYSWVAAEEDYEEYSGVLVFSGIYTPGLEIIEAATLNISGNVEAGGDPVYVEELSSDAKYTIAEQGWYTQEGADVLEGFEAGTVYNYSLLLEATDGYRFTSDTIGVLNGVDWDSFEVFLGYVDDYKPYFVFMGQYTVPEAETPTTEEATTEAPATTEEATTEEATTEAVTTEAATTAAATTATATEAVTTEAATTEAATTEAATTASQTTAANTTAPNTGDSNGVIIWISLLCVAIAGVFTMVATLKTRRQ